LPDCTSGGTQVGSAVTVDTSTNPDTATSAAFTPDTAGHYCWRAQYTPDQASQYLAASHTNLTTECFNVVKNDTAISTAADQTVSVGATISDSATLSGATSDAGGHIIFRAYGPGDGNCSNTAAFVSAAFPVSGNGTYGPASFTPDAAGNYRWIASYSGDAHNASAIGVCNDEGEMDTVTKAAPTITTSLVGGGHTGASITVTLGTAVHDTSTLHNATANAGGTVHYQVFTNATCDSLLSDAGTKAVTNGSVGDSNPITFSQAGTYYWQADYSGDANNEAASSACNLETVTVSQNIPAISTTASASVVVGGNISDTAHLSGGFNPTGTITFNLYGPDDATCSGPTAFSASVPVSGNGDYVSGNFQTAAAGTYRWTASYSGDANNATVSEGCNSANESVLVTIPGLHAEKLVSVNDGPFVHSSSAKPGDTLTFHLTITNTGDGDATNVPVSDDISALLAHAAYNDDASDGGVLNGSTLDWTIPSIAGNGGSVTLSFSVDLDSTFPAGSTDLPNTVVVTGPGSNCEAESGDADCSTTTTVEIPTLGLEKTNNAPIETIDLGNGQTADLPTAKEGATVTYTLKYTTNGVPQTNGVLTDVLPAGLTYVDGSATNSDEFTFVSATKNGDGTTTLEWDADNVTKGGTLSYDAKVDTGAAALAQPLENLATIQTDQEGPVSDTSDVFVQAPPQELTPPPTDTFSQPTTTSNPGFALMLILIGLAGLTLAIGFVTPVPERVRRRDRLG